MNPFIEKFKHYPNEKLIAILDEKKDYQPEAVEAAMLIIHERNISETQEREIRERIREQKEEKRQLAEKPPGMAEKILYLLLPFVGFLAWAFFATSYHEKGEERKKSELLIWILGGFILWGIVLYLLGAI